MNSKPMKKNQPSEVKDCSDDFGHTDPKITGESYSVTGMIGDQ